MKTSRLLLLVAVIVCASAMSFADTFYFNYSGSGVAASGTITATLQSSGNYLVTGMTGVRNGAAITSVMAASNSGFVQNGVRWTFDNLLFTAPPRFTDGGILFELAGIPTFANLYSIGGTLYDSIETGYGQFSSTEVNFNISETPEPASLMMFGSGLLGLCGLVRRKLMV